MEPIAGIFLLLILFISFMLRNIVYGYVADKMGDPTARLSGRLSANPLLHIDPVGSVILPGLLIFTGTGIIIGWPKPMPYNIYNFRNQKWGEVLLGLSGSGANFLIAVIFALIIRFSPGLTEAFVDLAVDVVLLNLFLAFFNLLPIPPLDGSKIIGRLLPLRLAYKYDKFVGMIAANPLLSFVLVLLIFVFLIGGVFFLAMVHLGSLLTGIDVNTLFTLYR